jgi:hypothetical protein
MPLTEFQREVARVISPNRGLESHLAGGAVLNRAVGGLRTSEDLDIFHDAFGAGRDAASIVASYAEADSQSLLAAGYQVEWLQRSGGFMRAVVRRGDDHVRLDWAADSAFRFFPAQPDPEFGYCLHRADLATNKILALAGRGEIRDYLDILELDQEYLSLGAIAWAACGKDEGYTPALILDMSNRHARYREIDLATETLSRPVDLKALKLHWIEARERADQLFSELVEAGETIGCLYLDTHLEPVTPNPKSPEFAGMLRHVPSDRGSTPGAP